jgi:uracil-DNA glycosylase
MNRKRKDLEKLKARIERKHGPYPKTFFFHDDKDLPGVKGFFGVSRVFFVAQKPSNGKFFSKQDKLFYSQLLRHGLKDVHITDLSKRVGGVVAKIDSKELFEQFEYFKQEMVCLKPRVLVALGNNVFNILHDLAFEYPKLFKGVLIYKVYHYAYTRRGGRNKRKFEEQIKRVARLCL